MTVRLSSHRRMRPRYIRRAIGEATPSSHRRMRQGVIGGARAISRPPSPCRTGCIHDLDDCRRHGCAWYREEYGNGANLCAAQSTTFRRFFPIVSFRDQFRRHRIAYQEVKRTKALHILAFRPHSLGCVRTVSGSKGGKLPEASVTIAPTTHRSRVTNGKALLAGVDGRSTWARRFRDLLNLHIADLGGEEAITEAERAILRRAAALMTELERMEVEFAKAEGADPDSLDLYSRTAGNLRRLLEAVGLQRRPKDVTPSLASYVEGRT